MKKDEKLMKRDRVAKKKEFKKLFSSSLNKLEDFSVVNWDFMYTNENNSWIFKGLTKILSKDLQQITIDGLILSHKEFIRIILCGSSLKILQILNCKLGEGKLQTKLSGNSSLKHLILSYEHITSSRRSRLPSEPKNLPQILHNISYCPCSSSLTHLHLLECRLPPFQSQVPQKTLNFPKTQFKLMNNRRVTFID
ncbi:unnamed protein product [Moneuplotes crassus]|uniref:Uncharacterized protein n=1 Tax=Euplotes crassus TaxID=5936 RepID=A0AAD1XUJ5_EUPCR|nr:unnamed protein product [Moneuplotes crassus]